MTIEVCPRCDIAGCIHIRERQAMSDQDLIRRGDAHNAVAHLWRSGGMIGGDWVQRKVLDAIAALPAVTSDREARLVEALGRAARALKPFADRVFNDNGDYTISDTHTLAPHDYCNAQAAERKARSLLAELETAK